MKLTNQEVKHMKANYKAMIEHPICRLQYVLAQYWLERLERKGRYALLGDR